MRLEVSEEGSKKKSRENFRYVIGSIIILIDVLPILPLAELLFIPKGKVAATLRFLRSLLDISQDPIFPIRLLHPS